MLISCIILQREKSEPNADEESDELKQLKMENDMSIDQLLKDYNLDENYFQTKFIPKKTTSEQLASSRADRLLKRQQNKMEIEQDPTDSQNKEDQEEAEEEDIDEEDEQENISEDLSEDSEQEEEENKNSPSLKCKQVST